MLRKLVVALLLLASLPGGVVWADNGPHQGQYSNTTDECARCHRAHRGQMPKLLITQSGMIVGVTQASQQGLCFTCHGSTASGADTNVEDGVYLSRDSGGQHGTVNAGLRGGGFVKALMDPDMDGKITSAVVTSKHNVGEIGTIWGNGAIDSNPNPGKANVLLECGSCHNPHGFRQADYYRILRPIPNDSDATAGVEVPDETTKNYTISYKSDGYRDVGYLTQVISYWCAQCHTRYLTSTTKDSGDAIFKYRHKTADNDRKCLVCHVAHGTSATMDTYSGSVEWPDGAAGGGSTDSRLLYVNNRGVCYQCHPSP